MIVYNIQHKRTALVNTRFDLDVHSIIYTAAGVCVCVGRVKVCAHFTLGGRYRGRFRGDLRKKFYALRHFSFISPS